MEQKHAVTVQMVLCYIVSDRFNDSYLHRLLRHQIYEAASPSFAGFDIEWKYCKADADKAEREAERQASVLSLLRSGTMLDYLQL